MNRNVRPVMFAFEPDVVSVFANILFGAAGAPSFVIGTSTQSNNVPTNKGLCNIALNSVSFTATTDGTTAVLTAVSSFAGLFVGMVVSGTGIFAGSTISSMNPGGGTITLSHVTTAAGTVTLSASGGQYALTFGSQFTPVKRLDTYVRLLSVAPFWDESGIDGGVSTGASAPAAPFVYLVQNNVANVNLSDIVFQCGYYTGATFTAAVPASGEILKLGIQLTRSTAI